jgi:hypothetical protein
VPKLEQGKIWNSYRSKMYIFLFGKVFKLVETKFERNKGVAVEIIFIRVLNNLVVSCAHMNDNLLTFILVGQCIEFG